jgi:hypothetical protein
MGDTTPITTSSTCAVSKVVAPLQLGQHAGQQVDGLDLVQAAVLLAFATGVRMAS